MSAPRNRASWGAAVRDSFWLLPAAFAIGAVLLGILVSALELRLSLSVGAILPSGPGGARDLLSAIITAMISFTVVEGGPLIRVHQVGDGPPRRPSGEDVAAAVSIGTERAPGQDVAFGFRQLADIAERALSPGSNDTTTAIRALQETHDLLRRVAARTPAPWIGSDEDGTVRALARRQSFDSFLAIAVDDVRYAARDQPRVASLLASVLSDLAKVAVPANIPDIRRRQTDERPR